MSELKPPPFYNKIKEYDTIVPHRYGPSGFNKFMHHRNLFKSYMVDFSLLCHKYDKQLAEYSCDVHSRALKTWNLTSSQAQLTENCLKEGKFLQKTIDFTKPNAVATLMTVQLKDHFDITVNIPPGRLVPTLSQKLNYILWIEDLLSVSYLDTIPFNDRFVGSNFTNGLDIGTGCCCIYAILGSVKNNWTFLCTEIDEQAYESAYQTIQGNQDKLASHITLVSKDTLEALKQSGAILPTLNTQTFDKFQFTMCNPPFYSLEQLDEDTGEEIIPDSTTDDMNEESLKVIQKIERRLIKRTGRVEWFKPTSDIAEIKPLSQNPALSAKRRGRKRKANPVSNQLDNITSTSDLCFKNSQQTLQESLGIITATSDENVLITKDKKLEPLQFDKNSPEMVELENVNSQTDKLINCETKSDNKNSADDTGGDFGFISQMLCESLTTDWMYKVDIFTTLIGKKSTLCKFLSIFNKGLFPKSNCLNDSTNSQNSTQEIPSNFQYTTGELCQGKTMRWVLAWTYQPYIKLPAPFSNYQNEAYTDTLEWSYNPEVNTILSNELFPNADQDFNVLSKFWGQFSSNDRVIDITDQKPVLCKKSQFTYLIASYLCCVLQDIFKSSLCIELRSVNSLPHTTTQNQNDKEMRIENKSMNTEFILVTRLNLPCYLNNFQCENNEEPNQDQTFASRENTETILHATCKETIDRHIALMINHYSKNNHCADGGSIQNLAQFYEVQTSNINETVFALAPNILNQFKFSCKLTVNITFESNAMLQDDKKDNIYIEQKKVLINPQNYLPKFSIEGEWINGYNPLHMHKWILMCKDIITAIIDHKIVNYMG